MQWAASEAQIVQSLRQEAQAALRANREPDGTGRADLAETIADHLQSGLVSRTQEMIKLENTLAADRCGHESERFRWQREIGSHTNAAKGWQDWQEKQGDDFKARAKADPSEQGAPDG